MIASDGREMTPSEDQDRCSGVLMLAVAAVMIVWSLTLPVGTVNSPGPGLFPLILAVLLAILSIGLTIEQIKAGSDGKAIASIVRKEGAQLTVFCALYLAYALTFERIGFILSTGAFLALVYVIVLRRSIVSALVYALVVTVPIYILFDRLLSVGLPRGLFG